MMNALILRFCFDERGATALEYALIAGIVSIAILGALLEIRPLVVENFDTAGAAFDQ